MLSCYVLLAVVAAAQGRAVNISNTWVLPEEGFPVFYRYFRDRISWYEADAVCQFHHANLVTVDTTAQYDAVRAYLKELDISSAVWVGLIRSNPEGQFTWTDYNALSGDGYWSSAPDARAAPLCAAADPAADYRWEARACGGPTVASFICELPVPQWAVGNQGCMVRALPALTVLYLPESAAVQLTADCGLAGTKRVQCTGNVKREDILKNLSCVEEVDATSVPPSVGTAESVTTDTTYTDQDTTNEVTTEQNTSPEHITDTPTLELKSTLSPILPTDMQNKRKVLNKLNIIHTNENLNLDLIHNNNLQSNDIPKLGYNDNFLTVEQTEKLEDEKHFSHKMMHEELARHGNFENIFTQPTDHFIPPLVMAKAKISDDMTVLSLAEKHAQQLAEQRHTKQNMQSQYKPHIGNNNPTKVTTEEPNKVEILDKPLVLATQSKVQDTEKKDKVKPGLPKKYKDKYDDPKSRSFRTIDNKLGKLEKSTQSYSTQSEITTRPIQTDTTPINNIKPEEDASIDLTVMLKELGVEDRGSRYSNYSTKIHKVDQEQKTTTAVSTPESTTIDDITTTQRTVEIQTKPPKNVPMTHEVVQITIVNDNVHSSNPTTTVFEITTGMPEFKDNENNYFSSHLTNTVSEQTTSATTVEEITPVHSIAIERSEKYTTSPTNIDITSSAIISTHHPLEPQKVVTPTEINTSTKSNEEQVIISSTIVSTAINKTKDIDNTTQEVISTTPTESTTTASTTLKHIDVMENYTESISKNIKNITDASDLSKITKVESTTSDIDHTNKGKKEVLNYTMSLEDDYAKNWTDSLEAIDDFQSPLLSGANEPAHRPHRYRRPQRARLNKFNPFRILG